MMEVPLSYPTSEEVETIRAFCNTGRFHNQGTAFCQHNALQGLGYMKHFLTRPLFLPWPVSVPSSGLATTAARGNASITA